MAVTPRTIDGLERDRRVADAVRVVADGAVVLTVPLEAVRAEALAVGTELSEGLYARLAGWADRHAAYRTALRLLERRPYARRDLGRRLTLKGHQGEPVAVALDRAEAAGFLDDERFARHFVQTRTARGHGPLRVRRELLQQGVDSGLIDRVIAEEVPDDAGLASVVALARKRAGQLADLEPPVRQRRVLAFLARRGYSGSEVRRIVRESI